MLRRPKKGDALLLSRHGLTIRKLTFRCVHIPAGPKKKPAPACCLSCTVFQRTSSPPRKKGKADAKVRLFPVSLQTSGRLFSGEKAAGPKRRGALAESGCKSTPFARNGKQNGGFFSRGSELFLRRGWNTGGYGEDAARKGMGTGGGYTFI